MSSTPSPARRTMLRILLTVAVIATVLPFGATPALAAGNNGVQLDGIDDAINLGAGGGSPLGATNFTLELWFKRTGTGVTASTGTSGATSAIPLLTKGRSEADGTNVDTNYFLGINTSTTGTGNPTPVTIANTLTADFEDTAAGLNHPVFGTTVITSNVWHHAAATFNGSQLCLYLDGVLDGTCTATTTVPRSDSIQIPAIGTAYNSLNQPVGFFAGQVDEARVWNVARAQGQIQSTMNQELTSGIGLIGRWGMNEGSGTAVGASVGPNAALVVGPLGTTVPTWVSGPAVGTPAATNFSVQLDGTDDAINLGAGGGSPLGASQFTLELWFKRTGLGTLASTGSGGNTDSVPLITKGTAEGDGSNIDANYFFGIDQSSGELEADFEDTATGLNHPVNGVTPVPMNGWHHGAATFNGAQLCVYLDGVLDGTCTATTTVPRFDSIQMPAVGTSYNSTGVPAGRFAGQVDEVRIWNVARTQAQIQSSMNTEIVSQMPGLLGRWGMNQGSGTSAANTAGSAGVNGTLVNGAAWATGAPPVEAPPVAGNYGVQFDGVDDQIDLGTASASALGASQYTLELWFKRTGAGSVAQTSGTAPGLTSVVPLITKGRSEADATNVDVNYFLGIDTASNKLATDFEEGSTGASPGANHGFIGNTVITNNVWHHAAVTYDGSVFRLYLDGALDGTSPLINQPPRSDSIDRVGIGVAYNSTGVTAGAFQGQIDEVRIWNAARSLAQIQGAMGSEITTGQANLLGRWGLNEGFWINAGSTGGTVNGTLVNGPTWVAGTTFTVPNTAPVVDSVVIDQGSPRTDDTLTSTVTSHDAEGNPVTYAYQWTKNGVDIAGATSATLNLATAGNGEKGDVIRLRVTASDASLTSAPVTSSPVTILNTVPSATVSLDDHTPGTNATLTATATKGDVDGDAVSLTYVWKVDGTAKQTITTTSLTDTFDLSVAGNGDNGQSVSVTVTPNDGSADGAPAVDTATVGNATPVVDSVTIDQSSPGTNVTLTTTVASHDDDGDTLTTSYQWTLGGSDISGETGATLDLSTLGNGDRGDLIRVRVSVSDGTATSAPLTSSPVTVANTAPEAGVVLDDHTPGTNATLTATATATDLDDDTVSLTYVWKVDGTTKQTITTTSLTDTFDLSVAGNGDNGQTVSVTVTPNDGTVDGDPAIDTATVGNATPVVDSVVIDQTSPQTNDTLTATVTSHDADDDTLTTDYQWTRNGDDIAGATDPTLDLSVLGNGDKGDLIRVRVTVSDGVATSAPATSDTVTVQNTAPTATVSLDDHSPSTSATLTATATSSDDDDDTVTLTYVWTVDGDVQQTTVTASTTDTFDLSLAGNGDNGDEVTVTVTPNDGDEEGAPASDSATVGNEPPVVDTVAIDQTTPGTNDTLSVTVTSHDPDGNPVTYAYQWSNDGDDISGATGDTLDLSVLGHGDRGDLIRVRVTASDGSATSGAVTSSPVTVLNTAPTATVSLDDHTPGTNATLTATATRADADGDTVTLTYLWTVNGVTRRTTTTTALTDTFDLSTVNNGNSGDAIVVTVTPNDGTANGSAATDSATVGNTAPTVNSVVIDQATPRTNDVLSASIQSSDPDSGSLTPSYQWTRNGTDISGATNPTLNLATAGNGDKGDLIRVRVTVSDGSATSGPLTSSAVTILNTQPAATVSLNDHAPGTDDTLIATATRTDVDGDTVTLTYLWTVNGVTRRTTTTTALTDTFNLALAGNGDAGQSVVVTVTPNDGTVDGSGVADTATVAAGGTPPVFIEDFSAGNFLNWTNNTRMTIDNALGSPAAPSARADVTSQSASAFLDLAQTQTQACMSTNVNVAARGATGLDLFRLRTAANGAMIKVFVTIQGNLQVRSDFASTGLDSGIALGTGWHNVELCGTVGSATNWSLYRDGVQIVNAWTANTGTAPIGRIQIGDTAAKTFTVNFDHVVLDHIPGDAPVSDTTAPTSPGQPMGTSPTAGTIQIVWAASTDDSPPITYRVYRDGNPTAITQTTATSFIDNGLTPGSSHTYTVDAVDSVNPTLPSVMSPASASILVSSGTPPIFSDDFDSGTMAAWTASTRLTIDNTIGSPGAPSSRAQVTSQSAFAYRDLGGTYPQVCLSVQINRVSGSGFDVFRLRTAGNGAVVKVVVNAGGNLQIRSDVAATSINSGVQLGTGWHTVELCGTVGTASSWNLYRDGVQIVTNWVANSGTTPVGRIQIGDAAAATFTANFDHVRLDQVVGDTQAPDTTAPTTPGQPVGSSPSVGTIQINWAASSDDSPPITYRVYRDGGPTAIGQTTATTYTDPGLTPGTSHTYTVDAVDSVNPSLPSAMSPVSASILVSSGTPPIFFEAFTAGNFLNWTNNTRLTIDNAIGSPAAPSALASVTNQSAFAFRDLSTTTMAPCLSLNVNRASGAFDIFRLRTAGGGPIVKVVVTAAGALQLRSDFGGTTFSSGVQLGTGWHSLELCGTVGNATSWDLYRDGVQIVTDWVADTGVTPVGRVQIGDTAAKTFTANFDDVRLDLVVGG